MKIVTGRGQISSPNNIKVIKSNLNFLDQNSETFFRDLARVIFSKMGVNLLSLPHSKDQIILAYIPLGGGPVFESQFENINQILSKNPNGIVIIISDRNTELSETNLIKLDPPYKRSADQSLVDSFKKLGLSDPSRVLFFSWERNPKDEQISALISLVGSKVKTILNLIENTTIISTIKK